MGYASHQKAALKEMTKDEKTNINNFNNNGINADDRVSIDTLILGGKFYVKNSRINSVRNVEHGRMLK